jgi:hypothetical protein
LPLTCLPCSNGLTLIINPQWTVGGNVVSDFGIFPWQRKAAQEVVGSFAEVGG